MIHLSTMTDENHVEFDVLKTKDLVKPHVRYSHFVFHLGRGVTRKVGTVPNLGCIIYYRAATEQADARNGRAGT